MPKIDRLQVVVCSECRCCWLMQLETRVLMIFKHLCMIMSSSRRGSFEHMWRA